MKLSKSKRSASKTKKPQEHIPKSPFGSFVENTKGYQFFTLSGSELDKWEVFELGYTDINKLLDGKYDKVLVKKVLVKKVEKEEVS